MGQNSQTIIVGCINCASKNSLFNMILALAISQIIGAVQS